MFVQFGLQAHWAAILLITLPKQALLIGGNEAKGQSLGIVLLLGAFVSMIGAPRGQPTLGYTVIFFLAAFYLLLGPVLVRRVRKVR